MILFIKFELKTGLARSVFLSNSQLRHQIPLSWGGSPGLLGMGDDSCLSDHWFESQHRILEGHIKTLICCKNCIVCLKIPKK